MKILTAAQMREIDRRTIEEYGIPGAVLMENAGIAVVDALRSRFHHLEDERIAIVCGPGNNGGDGFVIARHLHNLGLRPKVFLLAGKGAVKGDAALNLGIAEKLGLEISEVRTPAGRSRIKKALRSATLIIDAIFGTGLSHPAEGLPAAVIEEINASPAFKVAVDLPSGLSSDTFKLIGPAVRADLTIALGATKIAHVLPPAEKFAGQVQIVDISIPPALFASPELKLSLAEADDVVPFFRERPREGHKGTFGHILVLAGSRGKTGAAVLAGKAAYRAGAGLVTVAAPESCLRVIARSMPELMTEPLAETREGSISPAALPRLTQLLAGKDVVVIGPGLSAQPETAELVRKILPKIRVQVVLDADGLNVLAGHPNVLKAMSQPPILTPHPGEFGRLLGLSVPEVLNDRLNLASGYAVKNRVFLVLKGFRTLVASPDGRVSVNPTGNPGMGTGGAGDVLSGILGAFATGQEDVFGATVAAVYLHGEAGDAAAERLGERAMIAGDLIRYLPDAFKALEDLLVCSCGEHEP